MRWRLKAKKMRLSKIEYGCMQALAASSRSEDPSTQVGCAIEDASGRIIATGYNGLKAGVTIDADFLKDRSLKLDLFIHAETNALSLIRRGNGKVLYCTHSPCANCCQNIAAHGIERVVFVTKYHGCDKFWKILAQYSISVEQLPRESVDRIKAFLKTIGDRI